MKKYVVRSLKRAFVRADCQYCEWSYLFPVQEQGEPYVAMAAASPEAGQLVATHWRDEHQQDTGDNGIVKAFDYKKVFQ